MTTREEEQLASWLKSGCAGDERAYRLFLQSVSEIARGIISAKASGLSAEEKEDILQEILLGIHNKRGTWRQDHPVKPWVYAIARYKIIDTFRARGKAVFVDVDDFADQLVAPDDEAGVAMDVETLVGALKGKQAQVVRLIAMESMSISDVAQKLSMSEGAVRVNFHRGLEKLRERHKEQEQ